MTIKVRVAQKEGYSVLPRGSYELEIVGAEETQSKNTGTPQIELDLRVASGEFENRTFKDWIPLTEKSGFRLQQLLEACDPGQDIHTNVPTGEVDDKDNEINDIELNSVVDLVGLYFVADIVERKNPITGDPQNNIRRMHPLPDEEGDAKEEAAPPPEDKPAARGGGKGRAASRNTTPARRPRTR